MKFSWDSGKDSTLAFPTLGVLFRPPSIATCSLPPLPQFIWPLFILLELLRFWGLMQARIERTVGRASYLEWQIVYALCTSNNGRTLRRINISAMCVIRKMGPYCSRGNDYLRVSDIIGLNSSWETTDNLSSNMLTHRRNKNWTWICWAMCSTLLKLFKMWKPAADNDIEHIKGMAE